MKLSSVLAGRVNTIRDGLRAQLWPLPLFGIILGLALGVALPRLDESLDGHLSAGVTEYVFGGGPDAARTLLGAIVGSLITVTSLTFSLTVVTLQLASSQFSPRLLRTFSRDRYVHVTLALFLGTFSYALAVLRTVRNEDEGIIAFVPQLSISVAFLLCLASVIGLVVFLAHLARQIRVETMLVQVHGDAAEALRGILPTLEEGDGEAERGPAVPVDAAPMLAPGSGFLLSLDRELLLRAACEADAIVLIDRCPGSSLVEGVPVGVAWAREGRLDDGGAERLREALVGAAAIGMERTSVQDIGYGLKQLTDVCVKALSPGINDPTTAIHALGRTSSLLCELASRDLTPRLLHDDEGELRVILRQSEFRELVEEALGPPRRYGAADPFVMARLFTLLRELAWSSSLPEQHDVIAGQLARLRATVLAQDFDDVERAELAEVGAMVEAAQQGRWPVAESTGR